MKNNIGCAAVVTVVIFCVWGCSAAENNGADAGSSPIDSGRDTGAADVGDRGASDDVGEVADRGQSNLDACGVGCALPGVEAQFGANSVAFERAFFGLTSPEQSESGGWELHVEAHRGGADGCPTESSATASQTLIIARVPLEIGGTFTRADGIGVSVLDFEGTLIDDGTVAAALTAEVHLDSCDACPAPSPDSAVSLTIEAQLEGGGTVEGRVHATHCDSMDV